jgi:hypothetical protein
MWEIPVYAAERKDGIDHLVRANASVAYLSPTRIIKEDGEAYARERFNKAIAAKKDQFDLFYLDTILVTAGVSNKNDDVFLKTPTWAARHTPEDKPFNFGHNQLDIIGHITSSYVVDNEYNAIADDSTLDDLPDKFHILTGAVIYKAWSDKAQAERIEKIIAEIAEDKWFVSMECLFKGFDYGVMNTAGELNIIPRNESSAGLTKHLRAYGGTGKYQGNRICRVLDNFAFSGKGLVESPANPESIIFNDVETFKTVFANLGYINSCGSNVNDNKEIDMANETNELQKALDLVKAENDKLTKKLEEVSTQAAKASEDKINALTDSLTKAENKVKELETEATATAKEKDKMKDELDKKKKEAEDAKAEVDSLKKTVDEFKKASKVKSKASHLTDEEVTAFIEEWSGVSEAQFDKALDLVAKAGSSSNDSSVVNPKKGGLKPGDDDGAQKVNKGGKGAKTGGNVVAATDVLEDAEANDETAAAAANIGNTETLQTALAEFLGQKLQANKSRKR